MIRSRAPVPRPRGRGPESPATPESAGADPESDEDQAAVRPYHETAELPEPVRRRIVAELATFRSSVEIRALLRDKHGIQARLRDVVRFAEPLRILFQQLSADYLNGAAGLHIASPAYRLRRLQQLSLLAEHQDKLDLAAKLLDQAAKDQRAEPCGGGGARSGGIIPPTPEEAREEIEDFLKKAIGRLGSGRPD